MNLVVIGWLASAPVQASPQSSQTEASTVASPDLSAGLGHRSEITLKAFFKAGALVQVKTSAPAAMESQMIPKHLLRH
jgi:hypothetical protein